MASQPDLTAILAALAQRGTGTPNPQPSSTPQPPGSSGYPGAPSNPTPSNLGGLALPQPTNSGSLDLSSIKPASSGTVSLADAIAKSRNSGDKSSRDDPRLAGRAYRHDRSASKSPPRRESYRDNYNPFRDERRDDPRRTSNGRERSASPQGRGAFSPPAGRGYGRDRSPPPGQNVDSNTEIITVESSSVGLIIGRNGENLKRVESETGARVQFVTGPDTSAPLRQCKVSGTARQRADAKREIFRIVEENPRSAPPKGSSSSSMMQQQQQQQQQQHLQQQQQQQAPLREGEKSMQIMVPDKTVGLIIGRSGETIRDIQDRSGCHVNILGENRSVNGLRPVNLIGTRESSERAKQLILEVVESDTRAGPPQPSPPIPTYGRNSAPASNAFEPYGGGFDPNANAKITDTMIVPSEAVGMVIGKGGETIKDMQNFTGCKINVSPPTGPDINREIGLIGTRSAIEAAKRAIWEKVETVRAKQGGLRADTMNGYGESFPQHQPAPYGPTPPGPMPPPQGMPPPVAPDQPDPYAAYGGYQNYIAMWYAAFANQGPGQGPPPGP